MPHASATVPDDFRATIVRMLAYMGGLGILAIAAAGFFRPAATVVAAVHAAPPPEWVNVERPHPAFELQLPEPAAGPASYAILRRSADNARKDVMSWGEAGAAGPFAMVEIYRPGSQSDRFIDAPSEIAARIIAFTVTDDVKAAGPLDSKFGAVPLVDFAIAAGGRPRRCLGFAKAFDAPVMQIAGWYCNGKDQPVERATLACVLDRLTMLSAGGDGALAGLFARAEIHRNFCGARNPILAATPEREVPVPVPHTVRRPRPLQR